MTDAVPAPRRRLSGSVAIVYRRDGRFEPPGEWPSSMRGRIRRLDFGARGALFVALDGADAEDDGLFLVIRLGPLRDAAGARWTGARLLSERVASPAGIDGNRLTGNGMVIAIDLDAPRFAALGTLLAVPQLYFAPHAESFAAATEPGLLLPLLDRVEIDEDAVPAHFLFRFVPGERTYVRGVRRLYPGTQLCFHAGHVELAQLRRVRDLSFGTAHYDRYGATSTTWLDGQMVDIVAAGLEEARALGVGAGNLLSGGLDSSLVQAWLNELQPALPRRSWSFTVEAESFDFEEQYAREASSLLSTEHRFVRVAELDYPELFDRAIDTLAEPTLYNEGWACQLALADEIAADATAPRVLFAGNAADAVHGVGDLKPIDRWRRLRRLPGLQRVARAVLPLVRRLPGSLSWVEAIEMQGDPATCMDPTSFVSIAGELEFCLPAFGEQRVARAFEERRQLEVDQFASLDLFERIQILDLLSAGYDPTLAMVRLFAARGLDVIQVYLDEAAIAAPFAFSERIRYLRPHGRWRRRLKPLQQEMLKRRGLGALTGRKKGGTNFNPDLWRWMSQGRLRDRVEEIERPGWLSAAALADLKRRPTDFLWNLLVFDTFRRRVIEPAARRAAARRG